MPSLTSDDPREKRENELINSKPRKHTDAEVMLYLQIKRDKIRRTEIQSEQNPKPCKRKKTSNRAKKESPKKRKISQDDDNNQDQEQIVTVRNPHVPNHPEIQSTPRRKERFRKNLQLFQESEARAAQVHPTNIKPPKVPKDVQKVPMIPPHAPQNLHRPNSIRHFLAKPPDDQPSPAANVISPQPHILPSKSPASKPSVAITTRPYSKPKCKLSPNQPLITHFTANHPSHKFPRASTWTGTPPEPRTVDHSSTDSYSSRTVTKLNKCVNRPDINF